MVKKKKKGYLDNSEFIELLKEYETLNDDLSRWFDKKDPEKDAITKMKKRCERLKIPFEKNEEFYQLLEYNKNFKKYKEDLYIKRKEYLENETDELKVKRNKRLEIVKNKLGKNFLAIAENILKKPNFVNYDYFRKGSMTSDACMFCYSYIERFDINLDNPFSYFTQVVNSAFLQFINKSKKIDNQVITCSFIDNIYGESQEGEF